MQNPYVGPRPFSPEDVNAFFGRDQEINDIFSFVSSHRESVIYAKSGAGKSSLVNAGLIPRLQEEGFEVLSQGRVQGLAPTNTKLKEKENIYILNVLIGLSRSGSAKDLKSHTLSSYLKSLPRKKDPEGYDAPRVLIIDQFEELFTFYPERWKDREGFFSQISHALNQDPLLKVTFVMREDFLAELTPFQEIMPDRLRVQFRLERLKRDQALKAIKRPLQGTKRSFAPDVAERLVDDLRRVVSDSNMGKTSFLDEYVEPVQLQVVCNRLWENIPAEETLIREDSLVSIGGPQQVLSDFYKKAIQGTAKEVGLREGELRRWFRDVLITSSGTRNSVYRGEKETAGLPNEAVDELENHHIIRAERRKGARWYELNHDRFIQPIQKSNDEWLADRALSRQTKEKLEKRANEWNEQNQDPRRCLRTENEIQEAEEFLRSDDAKELGGSESLPAYVEVSRQTLEKEKASERAKRQRLEVEAARAKTFRRMALGMAALSVIALVAAGFAVILWNTAVEQRIRADKNAKQAERAEQEARVREFDAQGLRAEVQGSQAEAEYYRQEAEKIREQLTSAAAAAGQVSQASRTDEVDTQVEQLRQLERQLADSQSQSDQLQRELDQSRETNQKLLQRLNSSQLVQGSSTQGGSTLAADPAADPSERAGGTEVGSGNGASSPVDSTGGDDAPAPQPDQRRVAQRLVSASAEILKRVEEGPSEGRTDMLAYLAKAHLVASKAIPRELSQLLTSVPPLQLAHKDARDIAYSRSGTKIAAVGQIGEATPFVVWNAGTGSQLYTPVPDPEKRLPELLAVASAKGDTWATVGRDGSIQVWSGRTDGNTYTWYSFGASRRVADEARIRLNSINGGTRLAVAGLLPEGLGIWAMFSHREEARFNQRVTGMAFSSDGGLLATAGLDSQIRLWDIRRLPSQPKPLLALEISQPLSVALSPTGARMAASGAGNVVHIWDWKSAFELKREDKAPETRWNLPHKTDVFDIDFNLDGKQLATACQDGKARIWALGTAEGEQILEISHQNPVRRVAFSPDGSKLLTLDGSGRVQLHTVNFRGLLSREVQIAPSLCQEFFQQQACPLLR